MNKSRQKTKGWKIALTVLIAVGAIFSAVCVIYLNDYYRADAAASEALKSDDAAEGIQERFPEIEDWYIGSHSLGGAMAAGYVAEHVDENKGLILLTFYSTMDISKSGLQVLSVYGSEDAMHSLEVMESRKGMESRESVVRSRRNLPRNT